MGYVHCACCGMDIIGLLGDRCAGCHPDSTPDDYYEVCDLSITWHCFTGYCDGSGCTSYGECEADEVERDLNRGRFGVTV